VTPLPVPSWKRVKLQLEGKCAGYRFLNICGGGFRVRAVQVHGNLWAPDPACYLSDDEVATVETTA
jgi:Fe-coproporphyrin III synthase